MIIKIVNNFHVHLHAYVHILRGRGGRVCRIQKIDQEPDEHQRLVVAGVSPPPAVRCFVQFGNHAEPQLRRGPKHSSPGGTCLLREGT